MFRCVFAAAICSAYPAVPQTAQPPLRTLTTAAEAHDLTLEEARRGYPVHLKAVVTYYDPFIDARRPSLFVSDASGNVFLALPTFPAFMLNAGDLVEVQGISAAGDFAPIVSQASVRIIGRAPLPAKAERVSLGQLLTGRYDAHWVEIEGVVHSVRKSGKNVDLQVAVSDGLMNATAILEPGADYDRLVDAQVLIRGNTAPTFNRDFQLTGVHLLFPGLAQVKIKETAIADPFTLPVLPIDRLLRYTPNIAFRHRVHTRGPVTLQWPGRSLCIQSEGKGLCVRTSEAGVVAVGEVIDLAGFPSVGEFSPTLTDAVFRSTGRQQPVSAEPVTAEQALSGDQDSRLVEIGGMLIGEDRGAKDPTLVFSSGKFLFTALVPRSDGESAKLRWVPGSVLRMTGICSVQADTTESIRRGFSAPASFRILLGSRRDVLVVQNASPWTAAHLLPVLALLLLASLCGLGWVMALRHRVTVQARMIQKQNATLRSLSFQDGLTGVANRRKFDQMLELEFARARESRTEISLLMIDIDHFKLLNDNYGHQRGDDCLAQVAKALASATLRNTDLLARYGGEEFAVILPNSSESGAVAAGERMRRAVRDLSIVHDGSPFNQIVSVSVGTATILPAAQDKAASLIAMADQALYASKVQGRNRTTSASLSLGLLALPGRAV